MKTVLVKICFGTHCTMMGAMDILESVNEMKAELGEGEVEVEVVKCFDCKTPANAPIVIVGEQRIIAATAEKVMSKIMEEVNL
jgi:UbiD family decarboxylase